VRSAFALLLLLLAASAHAQDAAKPEDVAVGAVTLQIVETGSGEKELRHGARVLLKDFSVSAGRAAKFKDVDARVIEVGSGGNACGGWPAVVIVKDGKVAADTTMKNECAAFAASADEQGFTFVERPQPGTDGSVWSFTSDDGMHRLACWCSSRSRARRGPILPGCSITRSRYSTSRRSTRRCAS